MMDAGNERNGKRRNRKRRCCECRLDGSRRQTKSKTDDCSRLTTWDSSLHRHRELRIFRWTLKQVSARDAISKREKLSDDSRRRGEFTCYQQKYTCSQLKSARLILGYFCSHWLGESLKEAIERWSSQTVASIRVRNSNEVMSEWEAANERIRRGKLTGSSHYRQSKLWSDCAPLWWSHLPLTSDDLFSLFSTGQREWPWRRYK